MAKPIYRMSSAGACPRALSALRLGLATEPKPAWLEAAAEEGNWHEERIRDELRKEGLTVGLVQFEVTLDYPEFELVGHLDGIIMENNEPKMVLEIKSMSQFEFDRWMRGRFEEFPGYLAQIACYLQATGLTEVLYIVKNRSSGYKDRKGLFFDHAAIVTEVVDKLQAVENHVKANELHPADFIPQSIECRRCDYRPLCIPEPKKMSPVTEANLHQAVEGYRKAKVQENEIEKTLKDLREIFEQHSMATGDGRWIFDQMLFQTILVHRESYDKKELLELFKPEVIVSALKVQDYEQFKITDLQSRGKRSND